MSRLIITGFMGSGKSTVGRALAQRLDCEMVDLDEFIKHEEQRSARRIIEEDGEGSFREIESRVLSKVLDDPAAKVIALGGGAWISEANRQEIKARGGIAVWLDAPFDLCWKRISAYAGQRPLATSEAEARSLYTQRRSCYELAGLRVPITEARSADDIAAEIVTLLLVFGE